MYNRYGERTLTGPYGDSEMIKSNANLYHVKQLLGHKSFETLNHYAKLDITDLRKTHERCHPREKDEF